MYNHVGLCGRLTRDPELRRTNSGVAVASFSIAVDRDSKNSNGDTTTDFFDVVVWRQTAEFVSKYFTKGRMILVEGRLEQRRFTTKEGDKRNIVEIVAEHVYFADSKKGNGNAEDNADARSDYYSSYASAPSYSSEVPSSDFSVIDDDDAMLPF